MKVTYYQERYKSKEEYIASFKSIIKTLEEFNPNPNTA